MGSSGPRLPSTDKIHSETKDRGTSLALLCVAQAHPTPTFRYVRVEGQGQEREKSWIWRYWGEFRNTFIMKEMMERLILVTKDSL